MSDIVVCSFWVHRPKDFPHAADYPSMLLVLDNSCRRFGLRHVVLTDLKTSPRLDAIGLKSYAIDLPRNLMRAVTEVQAKWIESPYAAGVDTLFVGADCIIRRDIRGAVPPGDLVVAMMKGHKKWRLNTGFIYARAGARARVAALLRRVAEDCSETMCDDMAALERSLSPMRLDHGELEREGLTVQLVPLRQWNAVLDRVDDAAEDSYVLHFLGADGKRLFMPWVKAHMPELL